MSTVTWSINQTNRGDWEYDVNDGFAPDYASTYEEARDAVGARLAAAYFGVPQYEPRKFPYSYRGEIEDTLGGTEQT